MTRTGVNRLTFVLPLIFSALALVLVLTNIVLGAPRQPDENASTHIWQLLMLCQIPLILGFLATADWRTRSPALLLVVQLTAFASACLPVWLAGY